MTRRALFVTGTDTGVGKTLMAGALAATLAGRGARVGVMKPVETGCPVAIGDAAKQVDGVPGELDEHAQRALRRLGELAGPPPITVSTKTTPDALRPCDAELLRAMSGCSAPLDVINPYRYGPAVAPALAAELAERPIDPKRIVDCFQRLLQSHDFVIVEGAGGLLVPLTPSMLVLDLIVVLGLDALVVGRSSLGTINHTLLTVRALQARGVTVAGVVLNRLEKRPRPEEAANPRLIEAFAGDQLICGVLPYFDDTQRQDAAYLAERCAVHLDVNRLLSSG